MSSSPRIDFGGGLDGIVTRVANKRALREDEKTPAKYNWPDPLENEAFYGIAGEIVNAIEPHSEADPAAMLVQFLVGFGSIIGRKAHFITEKTPQYTSLYAVIVGQTAKGRKGTSWGQVRSVLRDADQEWADTRILGGLSSGEGLIWAVRDPIQEMNADCDPGVTDKRVLVYEAEFARVLQSGERETNTLFSVLRQAWDGEPLGILTKKNAARSVNSHISLVAHITKDEVRRLLTDTAKSGGFANRFLWTCARRSKELPEGGELEKVDFSGMKVQLKRAIEAAKTIGELRRDEKARAIWRAVYHNLSEGRPGMFGTITSRSDAQVVRLSTLYALLDCSAVIRAEHLKAALAVWRYAEDSARFIFGDTLGDPNADAILSQLRSRPEGMTRTEIRDLFGRNKKSAEIDQTLGVLQEYGLARKEKDEDGNGRPTEYWYPVASSPCTT